VPAVALGLALIFGLASVVLLASLIQRMRLGKSAKPSTPAAGRETQLQSSAADLAKVIEALHQLTLTLDQVGPSAFQGFFVVFFMLASLVCLGIAAYATHP
jgi:hypothetical protein